MRKLLLFVFVLTAVVSFGQSKTTQSLDEKYEGLSLYFYKNTLRMLNQTDNPDFDKMIENIEKMKFLMIDKTSEKFGKADYKKLTGEYTSEAFEAAMTSRMDGRNFDVYIKDKKGSPLATVILVNDSTNLFVLDIIGTVDLTKASSLFTALDGSTDIGKQIKNFTDRKEKEYRKVKKTN